MNFRKKTTATLLIAIFMISMMASAVALSVDFPSEYGIWLPQPLNGLVECSDAQFHGTSGYSAYLHVNYPTNPASTYGSDSTEVYVLPIAGIITLDDLDSFSFWYYWPSGVNSEIPPQVDIWLASTPPTEDAWLLGQIAEATTHDAWVEVPLSAITWINAMGGEIYGTGSVGLENAKDGIDGPAHGTRTIMGLGVMIGSPATRDEARTSESWYYIDDIEINSVVYDFEPTPTSSSTLNVDADGYTLEITEDGAGSVTPNPDQTKYAIGQSVALTATPDADWHFKEWTGDITGSVNPSSITMDDDKSVTAHFDPDIVNIYVTPTSVDFGSVMMGEVSSTFPVVVSNDGNVNVDISASVSTAFYEEYVRIDGSGILLWDSWTHSIVVDGTMPLDLTLDLTTCIEPGTHVDTLVFWAEETP